MLSSFFALDSNSITILEDFQRREERALREAADAKKREERALREADDAKKREKQALKKVEDVLNENEIIKQEFKFLQEKKYEEISRNQHVYVMSTDKMDTFKIGETCMTIKDRKKGIQTGNVDDIIVIFDFKTSDAKALESATHAVLKRFKCAREHFTCRSNFIGMIIKYLGFVMHTLTSAYPSITEEELKTKLSRMQDSTFMNTFAEMSVDVNKCKTYGLQQLESVRKNIPDDTDRLCKFIETYCEESDDKSSFVLCNDLLTLYKRMVPGGVKKPSWENAAKRCAFNVTYSHNCGRKNRHESGKRGILNLKMRHLH
jgi:hypothetical protein